MCLLDEPRDAVHILLACLKVFFEINCLVGRLRSEQFNGQLLIFLRELTILA